MARGAASPAPNALPKVSFVKVTDEVTQQPPGVHDHVAKSYGYNDFNDEFVLPEEHYIRYIEPLESDLATQVEYDMDEQDQEWLDAVNQERKAQQLDKVSYETFEIIMDRLEKEWFDLSKNIPKSDMALPSEDSTCAICDDSEGENTNAIVFCDGCNLAVHQDCYGVPYIPEGQWLCRKCTVSPENPVSCILCPNEGGAFKQTVSGEWVHLLCAIWVPETAVANDVFMEPITGVEKISKQRWKLRCSVCGIREGACIQCSRPSCFTAFHATCARKEKLLMPMKATQGSEAPTLACYCEKHLPREQQEVRAAALRAHHTDDSDIDEGQANSKSNKAARAYAKTYKPGPPLVPRIIVNRILQYISRIPIRHKSDFVQLVCRYWSLKREARRGAPLLKRLHLEPWTALSGSKQQTDEEKVMKLEHMKRLRLDLERVRLIIDVVRHRESTKQKQQEQIQLVLSRFFFPHEPALRFAFEKIISHDRQGYFKSPVNKNEVPDYYDIIKHPMCWDTIDRKLDSHEYLDLDEFKRDVELVVNNAMTYNQPNTPFYRTALRIQSSMSTLFADLDRTLSVPPARPKEEQVDGVAAKGEQLDGELVNGVQPDGDHVGDAASRSQTPPQRSLPPIGDLEPRLDLLELLISEELVRQDTNVVMLSTPIESLLNYEMPIIRPPAPPPPAPKPKTKPKPKPKKPKVDRKAALERKRQERLNALDSAPGFRAPRTRAARAAAAAFEAEATGDSSQPPESDAAQASPAVEGREDLSPSKAEKRPKKPRKSVVPPPQDLPLTVDNVDNRKSFTMFERGWILPPDQKRGGRARVERQPLPPPKKKAKTSHDQNRASVSSSAPAERSSSHAVDDQAGQDAGQESVPSHHSPHEPAHPYTPHVNVTTHDADMHPPTHGDSAPDHIPQHVPASDAATSPAAADPEPISIDRSRSPSRRATSTIPSHSPRPEVVALPEADADPMDVDEPAHHASPQSQARSPQQDITGHGETLEERRQADHQHEDEHEQERVEEDQAPAEEVEEHAEEEGAPAEMEEVVQEVPEQTHAPEDQSEQPEAEPPLPQPEEQPAEEEEVYTGPPRFIIIEELDTPATRREKNLRKKLQRQAAREAAAREAAARSAAAGSSTAPAPRHEQPPIAGPSRLTDEALGEDDSDLTDLSEVEEGTPQGEDIPSTAQPGVLQQPAQGPVVFRSSRRAPPAPSQPVPEVEPGAINVRPGEKLEGGTLVWAKIESFPWWPAVVFEEDDPEVPESVLARAPPREPDLELVRFYEKKHINNWAWVRHKNMRYLGEDDELDAQMLAPTSKYQRWRSNARRTECRNAYQDALAEMEADAEADMEPQLPAPAQAQPHPHPQRSQPQSQSQPPARKPPTRSSRGGSRSDVADHGPLADGGTNRGSASERADADTGEAEAQLMKSAEDGLVPAAMGADSPMTDVESLAD
ncbi:hypothetical protein OH77DRAFT_1429898 [Trametes cingulata]|nr:hypothetical protein OH77DRAFT_1429898 [Trametes cingulata]